jgi:methionyl-tRNA formyltransferase
MKIIVVGAVESTAVAIEQMCLQGLVPAAIITLPKQKRTLHSDYVDLSDIAAIHGIDILEEADVNTQECIDAVARLEPDFIFVIGWSRLVKEPFRNLASKGVLGYHPTLLPKMRGRAALAWTILLDIRNTGGTLFWIDEGIDSGNIAVQRSFDMEGTEYLADLYARQMDILSLMIQELIGELKAGQIPAATQEHGEATYLALRRPSDGLIDWACSAEEIQRAIRAVSKPYPGAFSYLDGAIVRIWRARVVDYAEWHALTGQIFLYDNHQPVVRCGYHTALLLEEYELEQAANNVGGPVKMIGQKRMSARP